MPSKSLKMLHTKLDIHTQKGLCSWDIFQPSTALQWPRQMHWWIEAVAGCRVQRSSDLKMPLCQRQRYDNKSGGVHGPEDGCKPALKHRFSPQIDRSTCRCCCCLVGRIWPIQTMLNHDPMLPGQLDRRGTTKALKWWEENAAGVWEHFSPGPSCIGENCCVLSRGP